MPEHFVARDRARRIGWNLEKILQERRLAWRGAEIGMASLKEDADLTLAEVAQDARTSATAVLAGDLRDRERGFLEIPFAVAVTTVATRVERAAALEADRLAGRVPAEEAQRGIAGELEAALARLETFQAAYDEKTPLLEARAIDLAHLLMRVGPRVGRPWDRPPPPMVTEPAALEDLLLAVREALGDHERPWRVTPPQAGAPLTLALGEGGGTARDDAVPPEVRRAAQVLAFRQPVEVLAHVAREADGTIGGFTIRLSDPAGEGLATTVAVATGGEAKLSPAAERAAHALLAAPPPSEEGIPPQRLVALAGLLQVLDQEVRERVAPGLARPDLRIAAAELPREKTRKAPLRKSFVDPLARAYPDLPVRRLSDLAEKAAAGRLAGKRLTTADFALLLGVFGRARSLAVGPLTPDEIEALVADLQDVTRIRRLLESGQAVPADDLTRLECAAVAALGRLGRNP